MVVFSGFAGGKMRKCFGVFGLMVLSGCTGDQFKTAEGCQIYMTELMQAETAACQSAYYEALAKQNGGLVSKCFPGPGGSMTCSTY